MNERGDLSKTFLHANKVLLILVVSGVLLYLASGFYVVEPEQRGVVTRFGKLVNDNVMPGMHYHWPWPIESVQRPRTTQVRSLSIAFRNNLQIKDSKDINVLEGGELLTGDENLVQANLQIQYIIRRPKNYLSNAVDPDAILRRLVKSSSIEHFASMTVDDVLTTGRNKLQAGLKQDIQTLADSYKLGIRLTSVQLQSVEPPGSSGVANAFKSVASAREEKQKLVQEAAGERNRLLPKARADAEARLRDAEAYAKEVMERSQGDSERFVAIWQEYNKAKSITSYRLYMDALEKIMPNVKKLIINPDAETLVYQ
jgi:membrane protease subunit HflK